MRKGFIWAIVLVVILSLTFIGTGCKDTTTAETTAAATTAAETTAAATTAAEITVKEEWVPYYKTKDFKPYVELPKLTLKELGPVEDETKVMPVDRVSPEPLKFAYLGGETNPYFDILKEGVDMAAQLLMTHNVYLEWIVPSATFSTADYGPAIETCVTKGYSAIFSFILSEGMLPYIDKAVEKGVIHAGIQAYVEPNKSLFYTGSDTYLGGVVAADAMAKLIGGKGKVGIIVNWFGDPGCDIGRAGGFEDRIKEAYPDIEIIGKVENQDQAEAARAATVDFLTAYPDLAGIYPTAGGPIGAAQALKDLNKTGQVKIVCFDPLPQTIEYIKDGSIAAAIGQDPIATGRDPAIRVFNYMMEGILPTAKYMYNRMDVVTLDTLDEFYASGQRG